MKQSTYTLLLLFVMCMVCSAIEVERKTFSMSLPDGWTEDTQDDMYDPDSFVMFENPESCLFMVLVGKKSAGASAEELLKRTEAEYQKKMTETKTVNITTWASFTGKGIEMEGKILGMLRSRARIFSFEKADNAYLLVEFGTLGDVKKFTDDFKKIRNTFSVKQ